jgi:hypothetical protein
MTPSLDDQIGDAITSMSDFVGEVNLRDLYELPTGDLDDLLEMMLRLQWMAEEMANVITHVIDSCHGLRAAAGHAAKLNEGTE